MTRLWLAAVIAWVALAPFEPAWADAARRTAAPAATTENRAPNSPPGLSASAPPRPAVENVVRLFETVVFGSELDPKLASTAIAKWQSPVRLAIRGKPSDRHLEFLGRHAATLSGLTDLSIELAKAGEAANVTVVFVPRAQMGKIQIGGVDQGLIERLAAPGGCYFVSWQKPVGTLIGAVIVANTDRDMASINHCLLEELTQTLGFPNDTDLVRPSIFSDRDQLYDLSRADVMVVRALYDPRLKPGMPKAEALKIVPAIIRELDARLP